MGIFCEEPSLNDLQFILFWNQSKKLYGIESYSGQNGNWRSHLLTPGVNASGNFGGTECALRP